MTSPSSIGLDANGKLDKLVFSQNYLNCAEALDYIITYTYNYLLCTLTFLSTAFSIQIKVIDCYCSFIEEHNRMYPAMPIEHSELLNFLTQFLT